MADAPPPPPDRRRFLRDAAALLASAAAAPSLAGLAAACTPRGPRGAAPGGRVGYGPLSPARGARELHVPAGFRVRRLSTVRRPSAADPRLVVRHGLDGMAAFPAGDGRVRLVRNHEARDLPGRLPALGPRPYDPLAPGGTTTLELVQHDDGSVSLEREFASLAGTVANCAGGPTPWGTWITCEETTVGSASGFARPHGYCFEVHADADGCEQPVPLHALGRFVHEAVCVDPGSGVVYLTEDQAIAPGRGAGFYRFTPARPGDLRAGRLEMLAVTGRPEYVTATGQLVGRPIPCTWVAIPDPDPDTAEQDPSAVFRQGWARGGTAFQRLEGCWWGDGNAYFNATSGGDARAGQVWAYRAQNETAGTLTLVFESPSRDVLDGPDNLCVSPRGGIVLCEDGEGEQHLRGLTREGRLFDFVRTARPSAEFAGACFAPDGRTLFFNIQGGTQAAHRADGATYAMWGPWTDGEL